MMSLTKHKSNEMYTSTTTFINTMAGYHKINISGVIFHVQSDCKSELLNHLDLLQKSFALKPNPLFESPEEQLADLLLSELNGGKDYITCQEIEELIDRTTHF